MSKAPEDESLPGWRGKVGRWVPSLKPFLYTTPAWAPRQRPPDESLGTAEPGEVRPPWIEYPGFEPADGFWRQSGEAWLTGIWEPYYNGLSPEEQAAYRERWKVPQVWWDFYFDPAWREFLESSDE